MIRRWLVRSVAWGFRRGVTLEQMRQALSRSFRHRDYEWREELVLDALARNRRKLMRRINA